MSECYDNDHIQSSPEHGFETRMRWQQTPIELPSLVRELMGGESLPVSSGVIEENITWLHNYLDSVEHKVIDDEESAIHSRKQFIHRADMYVDKRTGMILEIDYVEGALNTEVADDGNSIRLTIEVIVDRDELYRGGSNFPNHQLFVVGLDEELHEETNDLSSFAVQNLEMTLERCRALSEEN